MLRRNLLLPSTWKLQFPKARAHKFLKEQSSSWDTKHVLKCSKNSPKYMNLKIHYSVYWIAPHVPFQSQMKSDHILSYFRNINFNNMLACISRFLDFFPSGFLCKLLHEHFYSFNVMKLGSFLLGPNIPLAPSSRITSCYVSFQ